MVRKKVTINSSVEMPNKSIAVDAYACLCIRRLELLHKAIALTAMLLHRVATEPYKYYILSYLVMAKKTRGVIVTKHHTFGSLVIVLAGIFAVGALGINSGTLISQGTGDQSNLAGQASSAYDQVSSIRCGFDANANLVTCAPNLDGRYFENMVIIADPEPPLVLGSVEGSLVAYDGLPVVVSCKEISDACNMEHESACDILVVCPAYT